MTHGAKLFTIEYAPSVINEDIPKLPKVIKNTIKLAIEQRLMTNPIQFGKPLRYTLSGLRSLRVADYRIIYQIQSEDHIVNILSISHRKDAYTNL